MCTTRDVLSGCGVSLGAGLAGGAVLGAVNAGVGAATGSIGAAILTDAGYSGHSVTDATQMAAAGGALVGGAVGLVAAAVVAPLMFFHGSASVHASVKTKNRGSALGGAAGFVASELISGMIGYGLFLVQKEPIWNLVYMWQMWRLVLLFLQLFPLELHCYVAAVACTRACS